MKVKEERVIDKKKLVRESEHVTRPPRLEGVVKNAKMNPVKKEKKASSK